MKGLFTRPVFRVGEVQYYWEDVALAGVFGGDWPALVGLVRTELACVRSPRTPPATKADVDAAAAEFRYARDLVSAADMHAWLERWGLSVTEWMAYVRRALAHERAGAQAPEPGGPGPAPEEVEAALPATFVCSGTASRLASRLSTWAAAADGATADAMDDAELAPLLALLAPPLPPGGFSRLPTDRLTERARIVARAAVARERFRAQVLDPVALRRELEGHRLDWIRVEYRTASFAGESVAREAVLCVESDGLDLGEIVAQAGPGASLARGTQWLADVEAPLRDRMLAARAGETIGPLPAGERFVVHQIDCKRLPSLDDPAVRRRAEESAAARAFAGAANDRVAWQFSL